MVLQLGQSLPDPFNDVQLDVVFTDPHGSEHVVPAFWAGEQTWRVRYSSPLTGLHCSRTVCSDTGNADLHGQTGTLEVSPYEGQNPLIMHGPLRMAGDRRHLEYERRHALLLVGRYLVDGLHQAALVAGWLP